MWCGCGGGGPPASTQGPVDRSGSMRSAERAGWCMGVAFVGDAKPSKPRQGKQTKQARGARASFWWTGSLLFLFLCGWLVVACFVFGGQCCCLVFASLHGVVRSSSSGDTHIHHKIGKGHTILGYFVLLKGGILPRPFLFPYQSTRPAPRPSCHDACNKKNRQRPSYVWSRPSHNNGASAPVVPSIHPFYGTCTHTHNIVRLDPARPPSPYGWNLVYSFKTSGCSSSSVVFSVL